MTISGNNQTIVIGGSMAGLLAARVLADYYNTATIVERDRLPAIPKHALAYHSQVISVD